MFLYLQWFVDNDPTKPGQLVLFRTVPKNKVTTIKAGGSIMALQEQDTIGKVRMMFEAFDSHATESF